MKKLSNIIILLFLVLAVSAKKKEYTVSTPMEFIKAIGSDRTIVVNGTINLSNVLEDEELCKKANIAEVQSYTTPTEMISRCNNFDGYQLNISGCSNLTIRGEGTAVLQISPRYSYVLNFYNCNGISLEELTIGHTEEGYCEGGVLMYENCNGVEIKKCDLYGCGTEGIAAKNTSRLLCERSIIRDCSYYIMSIDNCPDATFNDCDFYRNQRYTLLNLRENGNINFTRCRFTQNMGCLWNITNSNVKVSASEIHHTQNMGNFNAEDHPTTKVFADNNDLAYKEVGPTNKTDLGVTKEFPIDFTTDEEHVVENTSPGPSALDEFLHFFDGWKKTGINIPAKKKANIKEMVKAFSNAFPGNSKFPQHEFKEFCAGRLDYWGVNPLDQTKVPDPQNTLKSYVNNSRSNIRIDIPNGYINVVTPENGGNMRASLWNRKNGHKLLVVTIYMSSDYVNDLQFYACYDFNPENNRMTPDIELYNKIQSAISSGYSTIELPYKGKDITLEKPDGKTCDIIWNGETFEINLPVNIDDL